MFASKQVKDTSETEIKIMLDGYITTRGTMVILNEPHDGACTIIADPNEKSPSSMSQTRGLRGAIKSDEFKDVLCKSYADFKDATYKLKQGMQLAAKSLESNEKISIVNVVFKGVLNGNKVRFVFEDIKDYEFKFLESFLEKQGLTSEESLQARPD